MGILNKLTPLTFKRLVEQIMTLSIDTAERLEGVIDIIHEKVLLIDLLSISKICFKKHCMRLPLF